jgi:hypothetical protein
MSRFSRKTILALAAIASAGFFAFAMDDASAAARGRGSHASGMARSHSIGHRAVARPGRIGHRHFGHRHFGHRHYAWGHRYRWGYRYGIAPAIATTGVATYAVAPTYNRCTCLTKTYTPEGAVLFRDVCTNEMAMNPPVEQLSQQSIPLQPGPGR